MFNTYHSVITTTAVVVLKVCKDTMDTAKPDSAKSNIISDGLEKFRSIKSNHAAESQTTVRCSGESPTTKEDYIIITARVVVPRDVHHAYSLVYDMHPLNLLEHRTYAARQHKLDDPYASR